MDIDKERKLFDIIFQMGIMIHTNIELKKKSTEEIAMWIADQLNKCGYYNIPLGCCWGVPVTEEAYKEYHTVKEGE